MVINKMLPVNRSPPIKRTKIKAIGNVPPAIILMIPGKLDLKTGSIPPVTVVVMMQAMQIKKPTNMPVLIKKIEEVLLAN
jgi:hypothetical protein